VRAIFAVHPRYGATCFTRRSANGFRNFIAPLSVWLPFGVASILVTLVT